MSGTRKAIAAAEAAVPLHEVGALVLEPTQPFAFDPTFHKPDHFPSPDTAWQPGIRWQTLRFRGHVFGLGIEDAGSRVRVRVWANRRPSDQLLRALGDE